MAETHFTGLILVLSVLWCACSCSHTGMQDEAQDVKAVLINGLREQMMEDSNSGNWSKSVELIMRKLDRTTIAYKQLTDIILNGYDPFITVQRGYIELIQVLLDNDLPINERYIHDIFTMLHGAVYFEKYELVNFLIKRGADLNVRSKYGDTPLHIAALMGYGKISELLVESGADIDATDDHGNTPLHLAANSGLLSLVMRLVHNGINTTICNTSGKTALDIAKQQGINNTFFLRYLGLKYLNSQ